MSDKYIIRNCPAQDVLGEECCYFNQYAKCEDSDCIMKQILTLAKGHTELCKDCNWQKENHFCEEDCNAYKLNKIVQLLDIQEIE